MNWFLEKLPTRAGDEVKLLGTLYQGGVVI